MDILDELPPESAAKARAIVSEVNRLHGRLHVRHDARYTRGPSAAKETDVSASEPNARMVEQAQSGLIRPTSVGSSLLESNPQASPIPSSIVEDLEKRVRVAEKHLHAEKQLTATLEEALIDLETQSNKIRTDGETWKKKASQLEEELHGLKKEQPLPSRMTVAIQKTGCYSTSHAPDDHAQSQMGSDGAGRRPASQNGVANKLERSDKDMSSQPQVCHPAKHSEAHPSSGRVHTHIVPAAHGYAFEVKSGDHFRIVDIHGQQVVDFMAWCAPYKGSKEYLSMSYTRHAIGGSAPPQVGECLYTNRDEPIFRLVADTVKTHDMLYMACNPGFYARLGQEGHRSCATNIAEVMKPFGMESYLDVTDPFNIFQNTPYYSLKGLNCSRAGDYVEFEALKDAVCAISSCPFDSDGFNGGHVTEVAVVTGLNK